MISIFNKYLKPYFNFSYSTKEKAVLIDKYREHDVYSLDLEIFPSTSINIPKKLPSEPPEGIRYDFGPSGYIFNSINTDTCVLPTEWKNINNYCHWTLCEIPLIYLTLACPSTYAALPKALLKGSLPFQKRWIEVLLSIFNHVKLDYSHKYSKLDASIIPINHDTSNNSRLIHKCPYKYYHHSRATPYCIELFKNLQQLFYSYNTEFPKKIYINRKKRRLKNEQEVQITLKIHGFEIIDLEYLSLDEQMFLFSNVQIVVAFHGAGLTNLLFCNQSAKIIEIVDPDCVYPCYKDGLVIPGTKATRTYYHMIAVMKDLHYKVVQSRNYFLDIDSLLKTIYL